jgi:hypothetical protein
MGLDQIHRERRKTSIDCIRIPSMPELQTQNRIFATAKLLWSHNRNTGRTKRTTYKTITRCQMTILLLLNWPLGWWNHTFGSYMILKRTSNIGEKTATKSSTLVTWMRMCAHPQSKISLPLYPCAKSSQEAMTPTLLLTHTIKDQNQLTGSGQPFTSSHTNADIQLSIMDAAGITESNGPTLLLKTFLVTTCQ